MPGIRDYASSCDVELLRVCNKAKSSEAAESTVLVLRIHDTVLGYGYCVPFTVLLSLRFGK